MAVPETARCPTTGERIPPNEPPEPNDRSSEVSERTPDLFSELKRRKVYKVAATYLAMAFAVLEGADLAFPALGLGSRVYNTLVVVSLMGFPLALALAWTFDISGSSIRRTAPAGHASVEVASDRWARPKAALVGAGFVAVLWWGVQLWRPTEPEEGGGVPVEEPVLAVLPFEDLSPEGDQVWFVEGLHEELLYQLGMLRGIGLTASTSVAHFRDSPASVSSIADSLGARFVLEGSVRRAPESINVTVRLNDAASGDQLWSDSFSRAMSLEGLLDLQRSIANRVAGSVGGTLAAGAGQVIGVPPTSDLEAYHAYLLGLHHFGRVQVFAAVDALRRAIELDPEFGRAHGKLARIYAGINNGGGGTQGELFPLMREHAQAAMRYAPDDPESHLAMGAVHWTIEWDWEAARQEAEAALALDPDHVDVIGALAEWHSAIAGNTDRALEILQEVNRIDPFSPLTLMVRGSILTNGRRHRESVEVFRRLVDLAGDDWWWRWWLASSLARAGEREEARVVLAELLPVIPSPPPVDMALPLALAGDTAEARGVLEEAGALKEAGGSVAASSLALGYAALGEIEIALAWLESSFEQEGGTYTLRHPDWDPLRPLPRFQALWDRLGLPEGGRGD